MAEKRKVDASDSPGEVEEHRSTLARLAGALLGGSSGVTGSLTLSAADALVKAEARHRALIEQIPAVTFMADLTGGLNEIYVSPQIEALLGFNAKEWVSNPVLWYRQLHPDDHEVLNREFARGCATGGPFRAECRFFSRSGSQVWVHGEARLIKDESGRPLMLQGVAFDITEGKRSEEVVRRSLQEKEVLLKEIHHRVKNNLQITSSLLRLQARRVAEPATRDILVDSENRIRSMALVHEMLYGSRDLDRIDFADYVHALTAQLLRSYNADPRAIRIELEVRTVPLTVGRAIPCGLILNELVSNCLKHAFRDGRSGTISISFTTTDGLDLLTIRDDGVGMAAVPAKGETLGLQLVHTLAEQLGGSLELLPVPGSGTEARVRMSGRRPHD